MPKTAIVIGAGIVGLAAARAFAIRGYQVSVFEREQMAVGASIRNFGMVWPIGQPTGPLYNRALKSRNIWFETATAAGIWNNPCGSVQCAYEDDELAVIEEFHAANAGERKCRLLTSAQALELSPFLNPTGLKGALFSADELIVDPREAIGKMSAYFTEKYGVRFHFGKLVSNIQYPAVFAGNERFEADEVYVCSGPDFETLYPEIFAATDITKCKLQMMRTAPYEAAGPAICGGMTLTHYGSFESCNALKVLKQRMAEQYPDYIKYGIHVMVAQNGLGELVIGDSHEYGLSHDPFIRTHINTLILDYLKTFTTFTDLEIGQTWHGIYPKLKKGTELVAHPEEGVTIINGLGGAGMSLSFGLLEEVIAKTFTMITKG